MTHAQIFQWLATVGCLFATSQTPAQTTSKTPKTDTEVLIQKPFVTGTDHLQLEIERAARQVLEQYNLYASMRQPSRSLDDSDRAADTVSAAAMKQFIALFSPGAEVFDDLHEPSHHLISPFDYASLAYNFIPRGISWTWKSKAVNTRKVMLYDGNSTPRACLFTFENDKLLFVGLDAKNRLLSFGKMRTVRLRLEISVEIATQKAQITNIFPNN